MSTEYKVIRESPEFSSLFRNVGGVHVSMDALQGVSVSETTTAVGRALALLIRLLPYLLGAFVAGLAALYADLGIPVALMVMAGVGIVAYIRLEGLEVHDSPVALERYRIDAIQETVELKLKHEHELRLTALQAALVQMGTPNGEQYTVINQRQLPGVAAHGGASEGRKQLSSQSHQADGVINDGTYRQDFEAGVR